jgi:protein-S-isoprenylcysteine O-methyltransferase Ste14
VTYFLFAFEQKSKAVRNFALTGRWLIMIGFGAIFGSTIMTRFALLVDRMYFLLIEWMRAGTGGA